jgi:hypothetical protein
VWNDSTLERTAVAAPQGTRCVVPLHFVACRTSARLLSSHSEILWVTEANGLSVLHLMNLLYAFFLMNNEHWIKLMYFIKMARKGF